MQKKAGTLKSGGKDMVTVSKSEVFKMLENAGVISAEERLAIEAVLKEESSVSSLNVEKQNYDLMISEIFRKIGIPCNIAGYKYLKFAVISVLEQPNLIERVTKELYPTVASNFDSTVSRVERAIRHAIEVAWKRGDSKMQIAIFGNTIDRSKKENPTNAEFIAGLVEYIKVN